MITDETIDKIVDRANELGLGARGLRSVTEELFTDLMYNIDQLPEKVSV